MLAPRSSYLTLFLDYLVYSCGLSNIYISESQIFISSPDLSPKLKTFIQPTDLTTPLRYLMGDWTSNILRQNFWLHTHVPQTHFPPSLSYFSVPGCLSPKSRKHPWFFFLLWLTILTTRPIFLSQTISQTHAPISEANTLIQASSTLADPVWQLC